MYHFLCADNFCRQRAKRKERVPLKNREWVLAKKERRRKQGR